MSIYNATATGSFGSSQYIVGTLAGGAPYLSIASAVGAAPAGATILIQPGIYTESISWPEGVTVQAVSASLSNQTVQINGNQTFTGDGSLAFQGILFYVGSGDVFSIASTGTDTSTVDFDNCSFANNGAGRCIVSSSAAGTCNLNFLNCKAVASSGSCANIQNGNLVSIQSSFVAGGTEGVHVGVSGLLQGTSSIFGSLNGSGIAVALSTSTSQYSGQNNKLQAVTGIHFQSTGNALSTFDTWYTSGTYYANAAVAGPTLSIGDPLFVTGATDADPQITVTVIPLAPGGSSPFVWTDLGTSGTLANNMGYFCTANLTATLPAAPPEGTEVAVYAVGSITITLTANAGQTIQFSNTTSATAGTAVNTQNGDSLTLIYRTTTASWKVVAAVGTWVVT